MVNKLLLVKVLHSFFFWRSQKIFHREIGSKRPKMILHNLCMSPYRVLKTAPLLPTFVETHAGLLSLVCLCKFVGHGLVFFTIDFH